MPGCNAAPDHPNPAHFSLTHVTIRQHIGCLDMYGEVGGEEVEEKGGGEPPLTERSLRIFLCP